VTQPAGKPACNCQTKPGEKVVPLYICCAKLGADGKPVNPKIQKLFPNIGKRATNGNNFSGTNF